MNKNISVEENVDNIFLEIEKLKEDVSKIHDIIKIEGGVTVSGVLCFLKNIENHFGNKTKGIENKIKELTFEQEDTNRKFNELYGIQSLMQYTQEGIEKCFERIEKLEASNIEKINKSDYEKISLKITEFEKEIDKLLILCSRIYDNKKPYKCPACKGIGKINRKSDLYRECDLCGGKGIIWG